MKVRVDLDRCVGHGRCYELAPQIFEEDEDGRCRLRREIVPQGLEREARLGEANCPENAIAVEE